MKTAGSLLVALLTALAQAQWTVVSLNPNENFMSEGEGVHGGTQVGSVIVGKPTAALWTGTPGSYVNLNPPGSIYSEAFAVSGNRQVGIAMFGGYFHAGIWSGTAGSWVDLNPVGSDQSHAYDIFNLVQVGDAFEPQRASLWNGTRESLVDLHPSGAVSSSARGVDAQSQVGFANFGTNHAGRWRGEQQTWVDLHPAGAFSSIALDVAGAQVVGSANFGDEHAYLWQGTTPIDLHPQGATYSEARSVHSLRQVGYAIINDVYRAALWTGTRNSRVDLHQFLPPGSTYSIANAVYVDAAKVSIVGQGNIGGSGTVALLWTARTVAPNFMQRLRGSYVSGDLGSLLESDNNRLVHSPGPTITSMESPIQIRVDAVAPSDNPNGLMFSVEASASASNLTQRVALYNFDTGVYEVLATQAVTLTDDVINVIVRSNPGRFIEAGTRSIRSLILCKANGPVLQYPWQHRIDKVWWTFPG